MLCLDISKYAVIFVPLSFSIVILLLALNIGKGKVFKKKEDNVKVYTISDKLKLPIRIDKLDKRQSDTLKHLYNEIDLSLEKHGKFYIVDIAQLYRFIYRDVLNQQITNFEFYGRKEFDRLNDLIKLFNNGHKETYELEIYSLINKILNNGVDVVEEIL